jgi:acyl-CoA synthetase (AMP-forming)/AMP-acid ligase II
MRTLDAVLAAYAKDRPDHVAVIRDDYRATYGELHRESDRLASALRAAGLGPGARVGYLGKESEHFFELLYACAKSGAVLVPVSWRLAAAETDHILRDSGARILFTQAEFLDTARRARTEVPELDSLVLCDGAEPGELALATWKSDTADIEWTHHSAADDPIAQLYTSGTTGFPKGVVLAHRTFFAVRDALAEAGLDWIDWLPGDKSLVCLPGSHIGGLWWAVQGFNAGITNVVLPVISSKAALDMIKKEGVTVTCLPPAMLAMLLSEPEVTGAWFATLRKVVYGGSPISESLLKRCLGVMDCEFAQLYGLTESGNTAVCLSPADHVRGGPLLKAAGRPYPGFGLKIVGGDGNELPTGEAGQVCLRTPAHMLGYWNLPEATARTLVEGWIHTGDIGYLDAAGYLFLRDRASDLIIRAGENIYPAEIENALSGHEAVAEVAVVGVPDDRWGEQVHAFVVLRAGHEVSPKELRDHLRGRIAEFKIPSRYRLVGEIPRNAAGKILRRTLREELWRHRDRKIN